MEVNIDIYRSRIGTFNSAGCFTYKPTSTRKRNYRKSSKNNNNLGNLFLKVVLIISILYYLENVQLSCMPNLQSKLETLSNISTASAHVLSFLAGSLLSISPIHLLQNCWVEGSPGLIAVALQAVQVVHLNIGKQFVVAPSLGLNVNFYARYTYGNRSSRGIKLTHWNAGSAFLENKINYIETLISSHHPHLLGISEANLRKDHNIGNCMIQDYELFTSKTMSNVNLQISRVVVYKHTSVVAKVREDLMSNNFSSIWLEVGFPGRTKILVCNLYRDWQYLGQTDNPFWISVSSWPAGSS